MHPPILTRDYCSAAAYSQIGQHDNAVSDAREAISVNPSFSKAYSRLGHALFSTGQYAEAVEAYEKGLELDPSVSPLSSLRRCLWEGDSL